MPQRSLSRIIRWIVPCLLLGRTLVAGAAPPTNTVPANPFTAPFPIPRLTEDKLILPESVADPLEPFNRGVWVFNRVLMTGFVQPTAKGYRFIVRKPVRTGIDNFGRNISFPVRLFNNLLQRRWTGARDETDRFVCNTIVGVGGFWDVATKLNIPKSDADFGQTLGKWGWKPQFYLMLPIYGPSNDRDTVGLAGDTAANPLTYISPYNLEIDDPLTYVSPYTYTYYFVMYNDLTDKVDDYSRTAKTQQDPYADIQYAWTFARDTRPPDFKLKGPKDPAALQTMASQFFKPTDPEFPNRGKTRAVTIPTTRKELKFTYWMQPKKAAMVYLVPGLGAHRLADNALALAEMMYSNGFSVAIISNPYNYEFMEKASTAAMPAYTPVDVRDLHVALTAINQKLERIYPGRLGAKALMGYSMGGFETLFMAGAGQTNYNGMPLLQFDRFVAINSPVRLLNGVSKLDEFYNAPLAWPAKERTADLKNTLLKVAAMTQNPTELSSPNDLPFDQVESEFLIGLVFRMTLRDVIYVSQSRHNMGILTLPINGWRREPLYDEILQYSYQDYFQKFVIPYYKKRGIDLTAPNALEKASDLRTYGESLHANPKIRLMVNRNDFLLPAEDLAWLQSTIPADQLTVFDQGGHLGNLANPQVQKVIIHMFDGLQPVRGAR